MGKLAVIVDFEIEPSELSAFLEAANENARLSVELEPGCHRFDVLCALEDKTKVTFYEVFDDASAFEAHATYAHASAFGAQAKPLILKASPRRAELVSA